MMTEKAAAAPMGEHDAFQGGEPVCWLDILDEDGNKPSPPSPNGAADPRASVEPSRPALDMVP